jgi:hypothetical protein
MFQEKESDFTCIKIAGVFSRVNVSTNKYIFMKCKAVVLITVIKPLVLAAAVVSCSVNPQQQSGY